MPQSVIHLFHGDDDSLPAGSPVAERIRQVASAQASPARSFVSVPPM